MYNAFGGALAREEFAVLFRSSVRIPMAAFVKLPETTRLPSGTPLALEYIRTAAPAFLGGLYAYEGACSHRDPFLDLPELPRLLLPPEVPRVPLDVPAFPAFPRFPATKSDISPQVSSNRLLVMLEFTLCAQFDGFKASSEILLPSRSRVLKSRPF